MGEFHSQRPQWSAAPSDDRLEYAEIEVPVNYADPAAGRLTLALSRLRATDPARRRGILLSANGGPGGNQGFGRALPRRLADATPLNEVYDLVGFDPRGTGDSTPLYSEVTPPTAPFDSRPPDSSFAALADDMREHEEGCRRAGGELRRHVSTRNTARDMDLIRAVLGEERLNFVGYAFGAYLGAVFGSMFPGSLDRSVLDSAVHPQWTWRELFLQQAVAVRENVGKWAEWTAARDRRFGLGTTAARVVAAVEEVARYLEEGADSAYLRTLYDGAVGTRATDRAQWETLGDLVGGLREAGGRAGPAGTVEKAGPLLAGQGTWQPGATKGELRLGVLEAVTLETYWPQDLDTYLRDMREFREKYPYGYGVMRAQPWVGAFRSFAAPEPPTDIRGGDHPAGLVVQADGDPFDHYSGGPATAERLGHHLITVADSGEHEVYALCGNGHVDALVNRYLVDGELPPRRYTTVPGTAPRPDIPADDAGAGRRTAEAA